MAERRRIILVDVMPYVPQARVYATLNPADKDASITLSSGNLVGTASPTGFGSVRATIPIVSGQHYWETRYTTLPTSGYTMLSGIATPQFVLASQPGFDAALPLLSIGAARHTDGNCYALSQQLATVGAVAANAVICHWVDADTGSYWVRKNGGVWQKILRRPNNAGSTWFPLINLSRNGAMRANFGATAFAYPVPITARAGVYTQPESEPTLIRLASGYVGGTLLERIHGRIAESPDLVASSEVSSWVWGGQTRSSRGQLGVVVSDGLVDEWRRLEWRGAVVRIYRGYDGDAPEDFELRSEERVEAIAWDDRRMTITLADPLSELDRAMPRPTYPIDSPNAVNVAQVCPITIGRPLYCAGRLRSTLTIGNDAYAYDLSDSAVRIDAVYDRGSLFNAAALDYVLTQDGRGFRLKSKPDGPVVANPAGPWLRNGGDNITASNGGTLNNWTGSPSVPSGWSQSATPWVAGNLFSAVAGGVGARIQATGSQIVLMQSGVAVAAGTYVVTLTVLAAPTAGVLTLLSGNTRQRVRIDRAGPCSVVVTFDVGGALGLVAGNDGVAALGALDVSIGTLRMYPARLAERLGDVIPYLVGLVSGIEMQPGAIAALTANGDDYRVAHYSDRDETVLSIVRRLLDGWCGWFVPTPAGKFTVGRVAAPGVSSLTLTPASIRSVNIDSDKASGLTTRLAGARNHCVHGDRDIATLVPNDLRALLTSEWAVVRTSQPTSPYVGIRYGQDPRRVAAAVAHADGAPPQQTMLQDSDDVQAEAGRTPTLWRDALPWFVMVECVLPAVVANQITEGQTVTIVWPRDGLAGGQDMIVVGVTAREWSRVVQLKLFWLEK